MMSLLRRTNWNVTLLSCRGATMQPNWGWRLAHWSLPALYFQKDKLNKGMPKRWVQLTDSICSAVLSSAFTHLSFAHLDFMTVGKWFSARLEYETVGEERSFIYISIKKKHADKQLCIWLLPHNFFLHQAVLSKLFWVLICLENAMGKNKIMRKPNPSRRFSLSLRINHMKKKKEKKRGTNLRLQTQYMTVPWKQVTRQFKVYF